MENFKPEIETLSLDSIVDVEGSVKASVILDKTIVVDVKESDESLESVDIFTSLNSVVVDGKVSAELSISK